MPSKRVACFTGTVIVGLVCALVCGQATTARTATPEADPVDCTSEPIPPTLEIVLAIGSETIPVAAETAERARQVIARRAAALAGDACRIWSDGVGQILVQFAGPNAPDLEVAQAALSETGLLELVDTQGQLLPAGTTIRTSLDPAPPDGATVAVGQVYETIVAGEDVADAYLTTNALGHLVVAFELGHEAANLFCEFTGSGVGQPLAVVLDKVVVSSPIVNSPICGGQGLVEGLTPVESQALVVQLLSGSLPTSVEVVGVFSLSMERLAVRLG